MTETNTMPTIALVDDDRNILTSVSIALEAEGYKVETYTDGASALDGLLARPPQLAIFDIKMPRRFGVRLLRGSGTPLRRAFQSYQSRYRPS